jgi:hypothetical protein
MKRCVESAKHYTVRKSRRIREAGYVACMGEKGIAFAVLVGKAEWNRCTVW